MSDSDSGDEYFDLKEEWDDRKPQRPKRPARKFSSFVAEVAGAKKHKNGKDLMRAASESWSKLSDAQKGHFNNDDAVAQYRNEMETYRNTMKAMKKPCESYALFVQNYWKTTKPKMDGKKKNHKEWFGDVSKDISKEWEKATPEVKAAFRAAAGVSKTLFEHEQMEVLSDKRELNLNWRNAGCEEVGRIMNNVKLPNVAIPVQNDDSDSDPEDVCDDPEEAKTCNNSSKKK